MNKLPTVSVLLGYLDPGLFSGHFLICAGNTQELFGRTQLNTDLRALTSFCRRVCLLALDPGLPDIRAGGMISPVEETVSDLSQAVPQKMAVTKPQVSCEENYGQYRAV